MLAIHEEQLVEHGGGVGIRDISLLESALARPKIRAVYGTSEEVDVASLAAAYAYGVTSNHPFVDGNKRTGFVLLELFLKLNGWQLNADDSDCITAMLALAAGETSEDDLTAWIRNHIQRDHLRVTPWLIYSKLLE